MGPQKEPQEARKIDPKQAWEESPGGPGNRERKMESNNGGLEEGPWVPKKRPQRGSQGGPVIVRKRSPMRALEGSPKGPWGAQEVDPKGALAGPRRGSDSYL
jgi:hypothetical protein